MDCLTRKFGFTTGAGTKHEALELYAEGRKVAITRLSRSHDEISDPLLSQIARQIHVNSRILRQMCECTVSAQEYIETLREQGRL